MRKLLPRDAYAAVGPDGEIDIDLLRRTGANARYGATCVAGKPWPQLAAAGWTIERVTVSGSTESVPVEQRPPEEKSPEGVPPPPTRRKAAAPAAQPSGPPQIRDRMTVDEYREAIAAGLVRFGRGH